MQVLKMFFNSLLMRELLLVLGICLIITMGIGITITFWEIPAPINQKTVTIPNEQFNKSAHKDSSQELWEQTEKVQVSNCVPNAAQQSKENVIYVTNQAINHLSVS